MIASRFALNDGDVVVVKQPPRGALRAAYDPDQPRGEDGKWADVGRDPGVPASHDNPKSPQWNRQYEPAKTDKKLTQAGFTMYYRKGNDDAFSNELTVVDKDNKIIGSLSFGPRLLGSEKGLEGSVDVHPTYRRQGMATAMYDLAEKLTKKTFAPAISQSKRGEAFWKARAERKRLRVAAFDPDQERDERGRWTATGATAVQQEQLAKARDEFEQPDWFSPGDNQTRVVWGVKAGDTIPLNKPSEVELDGYDELGAVHVGDPDYWMPRLVEDYDRDAAEARVILIRSTSDDVLADDVQYAMDPDGGDKATSNILLTPRKELKYGVDWVFDGEDFRSAAYNPDQERDERGRWTATGAANSPEFKAWFGGSKVTDEAGNPKIVYHRGSFNEDHEELLQIGEEGMHFGTKDAADARPVGKSVDDMIKSLVLEEDKETGRWHWSMDGADSYDLDENGFDSEEDARSDAEQQASTMGENYEWDEGDIPLTEVYLKIENPMRAVDQAGDWSKLVAKAKALGHDGIIYKNLFEDAGSTSYVIFDAKQVKSTKSERFDSGNPLITAAFNPDQERDDLGRWTSGGSTKTYETNDILPRYTGQYPSDRVSEIQEVPLDQITPTETTVNEGVVKSIMAAIERGDPLPAIVVQFSHDMDDGRDGLSISDGHHRFEAAKRLGLTHIPTRVVVDEDDWPQVKKHGGLTINGAVRHLAFNPDQERDEGGRWISGGGIAAVDKKLKTITDGTVDGLTIPDFDHEFGPDIPNVSSIKASLGNDYEVLDGIREVPLSEFEDNGKPSFYSATEERRVADLAAQIKENGWINPLIVVYDGDPKGPYVLEGGHRFDALKLNGAKALPALVVIDTSKLRAAEFNPDQPRDEGGRWTTEASQSLAEKHGTTLDITAASFILRDGTMVRSNSMHHQTLAEIAGTTLTALENEGVIRRAGSAIETPGVPTKKQALLIADSWNTDRNDTRHFLDVTVNGVTLGSVTFEGTVTADAIRNFAKRAVRNPKDQPPIHEVRRLARRREGPLHTAADAQVAKISVAIRYAFAQGRKVVDQGAEKAAEAVREALEQVLPGTLRKAAVAGGVAGVGMLRMRRAAELRALAFDPDQPRDEAGKWTGGGGSEVVVTPALLKVAMQDTDNAAHQHRSDMESDVQGVIVGSPRALDKSINRGDTTIEAVKKDYTATREFLRKEYGDTLKLYRVDAPVEHHSKKTLTVYMGDKRLADRFGESKPYEVKVDEVVAVYARPSGYYEFIVEKPSGGLRALAKHPLQMRFDVSDPAVAKWAKKHAGKLIKDLTATTLDAIKNAIADSSQGEGETPRSQYEAILDAVGNEDRAQLIARTEAMTAANAGQRIGWEQAIDKGFLPPTAKRTWITAAGACPLCEGLDGATAPMDGEYPEPGGEGPPQHPNCRCTEGIV